MTTNIIVSYALMAGASYISNRDPIHRFPVPDGWTASRYEHPPGSSGFEAISFVKGTDVVISFADTDFSKWGSDFLYGNIPLLFGRVSEQLKQAAD